jgi:hypothetical protein
MAATNPDVGQRLRAAALSREFSARRHGQHDVSPQHPESPAGRHELHVWGWSAGVGRNRQVAQDRVNAVGFLDGVELGFKRRINLVAQIVPLHEITDRDRE